MTTVMLIRHATTDAAGVTLAGRSHGVHLNARGRREAGELPARLVHAMPQAIYSSPIERALETAAPMAAEYGTVVDARQGLTEVDFGEWTGCRIGALSGDPVWRRFNSDRSGTRIPGGESMLEVQARVVSQLDELRRANDRRTVAVVTHADVIRAALAHYGAMSLEACLRFDVQPASITILLLADYQPVIALVNELGTVSADHFRMQ